MQTITYYHAGCPVCVEAESKVVSTLDTNQYNIEIVDLNTAKKRVDEAIQLGVKSVPALIIDGLPFHINFGALIDDLRA
ncbi:MAG: conjugal transfer protein TraF [Epsilonproteobacteria bacterium]|nr:conjugal transfer protein TraF [Campylobacterota bacterium]